MTDLQHAPREARPRPRSRPPKPVPHLSAAERAAKGKAAREAASRSAHGDWAPDTDRRDPVELLEEQGASRVQELVPVRYGRMLVSPFTFYRGAAYLMAADLARAPRTDLQVQLCGDAHLSNFGAFAAPDRRLIFSINDFDETLPGPFEWDVKRLVASFAVAGRDRGFDTKERQRINQAVARAYREAMAEYAGMSNLDVWYSRIDMDDVATRAADLGSRKQRKTFERNVAKARSKDSLKAFTKLTEVVDGERRIVSDPPLIVPIEDIMSGAARHEVEDFVRGVIRSYRRTLTADRRRLLERYRYVHAARKVVGVGSVGTRAWIVLMLGRDDSDPLLLQLKEAQASVLEPFLGDSTFANHGQRVVEGQRLTQAASDILLGWIRFTAPDGVSRDFYMRQLWDGKGSALVELMNAHGDARLRRALRPGAREGARPLRGRDRDHELPRARRDVRPGDGVVRRALRRPERARLRRPAGGRRVGARRLADRPVGSVDWSLAILAATLLGVAAISRRLYGTPVTPAMVFVVVGLLLGPAGARRDRRRGVERDRADARGGDARARAVLRRLEHRPPRAPP